MAASSCTRWSRSARTDESISVIQVLIVAASIALDVINLLVLASPAQRGGVNRRIPKLCQLIVQLQHGQRRACHLERRDVAADEVARGLEPGLAQLRLDVPIEKVELD